MFNAHRWAGFRVLYDEHDDAGTTITEPAEAVEAAPAEPAEPVAEATQIPEWEQRGLKTTEDVWKSYREAEAAKTRAEQEAAEYRRQVEAAQAEPEYEDEPEDPWDALPLDLDEQQRQRIYAAAQRDLPGTAQHIWRNREHFGQETANLLMQAWSQHDYAGAQQFILAEHETRLRDEITNQLQSQWMEAFGPVVKTQQQEWIEAAYTKAGQEVADLDDYADRIAEYLTSERGQQAMRGTRGNPTAMAEIVVQLRDHFWAADERAKRRAPKPTEAVAEKPEGLGKSAAPEGDLSPQQQREREVKASLRNPRVRAASGLM